MSKMDGIRRRVYKALGTLPRKIELRFVDNPERVENPPGGDIVIELPSELNGV